MCVLTINYNLKLRLQRSIGNFRIGWFLFFWCRCKTMFEAEFDLPLPYGGKAKQKVCPTKSTDTIRLENFKFSRGEICVANFIPPVNDRIFST